MKKYTALLLAVLTIFSLAACGSGASAARSESSYVSSPASVPAASYDSGFSYEYGHSDPIDEVAIPMAESAAGKSSSGLSSSNAVSGTQVSAKAGGSAVVPDPGDIAVDKIIYSATATVETTDFDDTLTRLEAMIAQYGGFVEASSISGNNYYHSSRGYSSQRSAAYRIRIPSRDFGTVMNSLSTLGNVPSSKTTTENVTSQYYDAQSRLEAYRAEEKSLLEMMEKAETVEDLLKIQDYLSEVRYNIESMQSKLTNWDRQVSYSTISVTVQEVEVYTPETKMSFIQQLGLALSRGLKSIGEFFRDLLLWLLEALPALVVLAALVVLVFFLVRRIRRRAKARREKKLAAQAQAAAKAQESAVKAQEQSQESAAK